MAEKKKTEATATPARKTTTRRASTSRAKSATAPAALSYEMIAERAYHISQSEDSGSPDDNWLRAEAELLSV